MLLNFNYNLSLNFTSANLAKKQFVLGWLIMILQPIHCGELWFSPLFISHARDERSSAYDDFGCFDTIVA